MTAADAADGRGCTLGQHVDLSHNAGDGEKNARTFPPSKKIVAHHSVLVSQKVGMTKTANTGKLKSEAVRILKCLFPVQPRMFQSLGVTVKANI